ncbi:hypothetical protein D9611_005738 [Ephemerocybe angulata]|uniref:Chromatin remodeling factor mit1 n=1 Tax=Ephemerocybe angulata TaxID=980116 RepID=A0A8H5BI19_9AGAR|nr:hypothetical protein D9611_005738 [Tulosesus angulatus]
MDETIPPSSEESPLSSLADSPRHSTLATRNNCYIELTPLPESRKKQYRPFAEVMLSFESDEKVDEVIGEYRDGGNLYYFARWRDGIAHKFLAEKFLEKHGDLVEAFNKAKRSRNFKHANFDPSASYIHPLSRVKMKINISQDRYKTKAGSSSRGAPSSDGMDFAPASQDEEEDNDEGEDSDGYAETSAPKRVTRQSKLPFSPRKSRSQRIIPLDESGSERGASAGPARRLTRGRAVKVTVGSEYADSDDEEGDDDSDFALSRRVPAAKPKRMKQPKFSPPSYGNVRSIEAISYDDYPDDPKNAALRAHRAICEKCHLVPAHELLQTMKKKKGKKRKRGSEDEFDYSDDEDRYKDLGGWVRCLRCPVSCHWSCMPGTQRDEILKAARAKEREDHESRGNDPADLKRRKFLEAEETTEFICASCTKGGVCMGCMDEISPATDLQKPLDADGDVEMGEPSNTAQADLMMARELHFRCLTCKRLAHYGHLPVPPALPEDANLSKIAMHYQYKNSWLCADCASFQYPLDKIIAWRPYPANAQESLKSAPHYKDQLPREYLVKWADRSYRRLSWVPHMWLVSTNPGKLKNFLADGTKVELLKEISEGDGNAASDSPFEIGAEKSRSLSSKPTTSFGPLDALPDAEKRIAPSWQTVDRVLEVLIWTKASKKKGKGKKPQKRIESDDDEDMEDDDLPEELGHTFEHGEEPDQDLTMRPEDWERREKSRLSEGDIDKVVWIFAKWGDLGYDEASWDSPPRRGEPGYSAYVTAFKRYLRARDVMVPIPDKKYVDAFENRRPDDFRRKYALKDPAGLKLGQDPSLKLMPFQVDGFNWLCNNWWNHQPCILADDMGLGKTVQMSTFLGTIATEWKAFPALVVVPNSTITNWVREFERWAPELRVVPFYGEKKARDIIKQFELFHRDAPSKQHTKAKFHVLITTYEAAINPKDFGTIFKKQPRWEALVIDEGQRLKSDSSLLFRKLNELNSIHRVIMTGTPLNNNMRELFNLMNFLDPKEWNDLEGLEREHTQENLNEDMIKQLHSRLRPYFLRRIKSEVLDLPPKNEVIIPVTMAPLQRQVYRSILSHNLDLLKGLTQPTRNGSKGKLSNVLMHLRKCLQHPYLHSEDIEPRGLSAQETHHKLIDASAKLRFLKTLLPKLKERGHRVLLFSQFVLALDVIEDFLKGEGYKFLRLDGNTKGTDRQKSMDEYNKPNSEYFIFLLTTRAGGVGINLFTADTVVIFDPDFNPHQDLQAIARAYRYGQKKTCLVFKLMVKDSAEERIMQIGKKKLVLDHLIVQKMDDDEDSPGENVESILTYGAQALFDSDEASKDIQYSESDIDQLIEKTEKEGDGSDVPKEGAAFSFAKVWSADKDQLEEVADEDQVDSWAQTLVKINEEREKERQEEIAVSGRGARRKAADVAKSKMVIGGSFDAPSTGKQRGRSGSDASNYKSPEASENEGGSGPSSEGEPEDDDFKMDIDSGEKKKKRKKRTKLEIMADFASNAGTGVTTTSNGVNVRIVPQAGPTLNCGLCGSNHGVKQCLMTDNSNNLAEYRLMLIMHADDEPWEERNAAIRAIDEILNVRGALSLIQGQPLHPIAKTTNVPPTKKPKETMEIVAAHYKEKQQSRKQMPAPTSTQPLKYQEKHIANTVIRDYTTAANAQASSSRTGGGGVVVNTPASGSGTQRAAMVVPSAGLSRSSPLTSLPASGSSRETQGSVATASSNGTASATAPNVESKCVVCGSKGGHFLKDCPIVKEGPTTVSTIIAQFEQDSDPKKADAVTTLRRILVKQKKAQQKAEAAMSMQL